MRYLCSTFGSSGDVFPMLGLALELRRRGHEVTFATNGHYASLAAKHEMPFVALGTDDEFHACIQHPDLWHPTRSLPLIFRTMQPSLRQQYELYMRHASHVDAVGITTLFGFGALFAQEKTGLPLITVHLQPSVIWSEIAPPVVAGMFGPRWLRKYMYRVGERFIIDPMLCPYLNSWRTEIGLPPIKRITRYWHSPFGVLCMFPAWFCPPQSDWPANVMQTDFPMWNDRQKSTTATRHTAPEFDAADRADLSRYSAELARFLQDGHAPIAFTPGSTNIHGREFFTAAVEACRLLGRKGILLTEFPDQLPQPLPPEVLHVLYVPLDQLLPHCSAFVHHGGIGSSSQAMAAGIPQLIMAMAHDQLDNESRLRKLNIGDGLPPKKFTGTRLAAKLQALLTSPSVAAACRAVAAKMTNQNGLEQSADAIERRVAAR